MSRQARGEVAYLAVARDLRAAILDHQYGEDDRLPTEAELVEKYKVSRQTVRHAMRELVTEGLVYRVPGRGTFPSRGGAGGEYLWHFGSNADLMGMSVDSAMQVMVPLARRVDTAAAARLRLDSDAVMTATFLRLHDGSPFGVTVVHLPPFIGTQLIEIESLTEPGRVSDTTVLRLIDEKCGVKVAYAEQSITVAMLPESAAGYLNAETGKAVMQTDRVYFDNADRPVELAISHILPELYSYRIRLRRSQT